MAGLLRARPMPWGRPGASHERQAGERPCHCRPLSPHVAGLTGTSLLRKARSLARSCAQWAPMEARTRICRLAVAVLCRRVAARAAETGTVDSGYALWPTCPLHPPPGWTPPRLPGGRRGGTGSGVPVRVGQPPLAGVGPSRVRGVPRQVVVVLAADLVRPPGQWPVGPGADRPRVRGLDG